MHEGLIDYFAGVLGGVAVCFVGHPFDTVKTRLQTSPNGYYSSTIDCVKKTVRKEGLGGFYSGVMSPLAGQMFFRAFSFFTFHRAVSYLSAEDGISNGQLVAAGGLTGLVISAVETPIDLIKTKLQIQVFASEKAKFNTVRGAIRYFSSTYGTRALWQGWSATAIRNIPANAVFFPVNEILKKRFAKGRGVAVKELELHERLIAGGTGGMCYWVGTYPLDRIKGVVQAQRFQDQISYVSMVRKIYASEGWRGFYVGLGPCAARSAPACAAMFAVVDLTRQSLGGGDH